jgi:hypothetical protein
MAEVPCGWDDGDLLEELSRLQIQWFILQPLRSMFSKPRQEIKPGDGLFLSFRALFRPPILIYGTPQIGIHSFDVVV